MSDDIRIALSDSVVEIADRLFALTRDKSAQDPPVFNAQFEDCPREPLLLSHVWRETMA